MVYMLVYMMCESLLQAPILFKRLVFVHKFDTCHSYAREKRLSYLHNYS